MAASTRVRWLWAAIVVGVAAAQQPEASLVLKDSPAQYHVVLAALRSVLYLGGAEAAASAAEAHDAGASVVLIGSRRACEEAAGELREYGLVVDVQQLSPGSWYGWGAVLLHDDASTSADVALSALTSLGLDSGAAETAIEEIEAVGAAFVFRGTMDACTKARDQLRHAGLSADVRVDLSRVRLAGQLGLDKL